MMVRAEKTVDIGESPEVLRLAEDVESSGQPTVLQRNGKAIAKLVPVEPVKGKKRRRGSRAENPFAKLVGIGASGGSDIAEHKHEYIAQAIESHWKE